MEFWTHNWPTIQHLASTLWDVGVTVASLWTAYQARQISTLKKGGGNAP